MRHLLSSNSSYLSNVESSSTIDSQTGEDKENDDGNSGEDILKGNPETSDENIDSDEEETLNNNSSKAAETPDGNEQEIDFEIVGYTPSENTIYHSVEVQSDHQDDANGVMRLQRFQVSKICTYLSNFLGRNVLFLVMCNLLFKTHLFLNIKNVLEKVGIYVHLFETKCFTDFVVFKKPLFKCFS